MQKINFYIEEEDLKFLKSLSGRLSDHIRYALETYIHQIQKEENRRVSASQSERGGNNE